LFHAHTVHVPNFFLRMMIAHLLSLLVHDGNHMNMREFHIELIKSNFLLYGLLDIGVCVCVCAHMHVHAHTCNMVTL